MRAVLDTNVVVSALLWGGTPDRLIQATIDGALELATSPALIDELREVLARPPLASRLTQERMRAEQAVSLYARLATQVSPLAIEKIVTADPDDDEVLACAIAARADLVVSGDRHLTALKTHRGIRILTPAQALDIVAGG
jgi:putative PIN family toxin of toxin-antitoxin system